MRVQLVALLQQRRAHARRETEMAAQDAAAEAAGRDTRVPRASTIAP